MVDAVCAGSMLAPGVATTVADGAIAPETVAGAIVTVTKASINRTAVKVMLSHMMNLPGLFFFRRYGLNIRITRMDCLNNRIGCDMDLKGLNTEKLECLAAFGERHSAGYKSGFLKLGEMHIQQWSGHTHTSSKLAHVHFLIRQACKNSHALGTGNSGQLAGQHLGSQFHNAPSFMCNKKLTHVYIV